MGLGLEIYLIFDIEEPFEKYLELKDRYLFDHRSGLNLIMTGEGDAGDEDRLLRQVEKVLNIDLTLLDFWDYADEHEGYINIKPLYMKLIELQNALVENPEYYRKICWGHDIEDKYLKDNFLKDVRFLIERLNLNLENGASLVKYISD
ncbi:hypothetical protein BBH99_11875 [Chryseobacterium contaminans]|uniref:Uncharacterized protein n=1 Tax=Chryseobacterium contaminans TaxID=1423959 RepID=A0A1M7IM56_9FLAO|nr:hypothetical protein [Chryseobacterium contaminans]OCA76883.1 hypothetical protein BBH99_11875 [Chryseobacterium contaminans]SHM41904.1 hypothetical protein SAMN05444407_1164 [Chryseobacterium contaminans]